MLFPAKFYLDRCTMSHL